MKTLLWVVGIAFILVGVLGWFDNPLVGEDGFFETNTAHDYVHLLLGALLILVAIVAGVESVAPALLGVGAVYLLLAVVGFFQAPDGGVVLGIAEMNTADHWLHVVLGGGLLILGFLARGTRTAMARL
jgi:hypothetical protein